ncbi:pyrroloquinoline quinone biosynthesis protein PqqE [Dactylosporangium sp. NPDC005572]|uniref:pyrroloquinoline quinone biosynthesis protein PqqE n=1 Tax=Dactylosporangium sp. NPDC005572 TaxID=3156889 RepID=UPI0033A81631
MSVAGLRVGVRLVYDRVRARPALLYPEGVLLLNETAGQIVARCNGVRTSGDIADDLTRDYDGVSAEDVSALLGDLADRRLVALDGTGSPAEIVGFDTAGDDLGPPPRDPAPLGLLAELTYRCPQHCTYCSNPVELSAYRDELTTADWRRVLAEARDLGVLQVHLSGGEPMLRPDLVDLVAHARTLGLYSNLVTSGIPLPEARLAELAAAGLDHLQLSIQDSAPAAADEVAGLRAHDRKLTLARQVRAYGLPLTVNVVLHRGNVGRLLAIAELAATLGADRLELAHTQFYGWGLRNRAALMPTVQQVATAQLDAATARARYGDALELVYVTADYHTDRPKPCMSGWGTRQLVVAPNGDTLPCLAAAQLPGLGIENVRSRPLSDIWYSSTSFNRFRGTAWMPEPCRSCTLREVDFGGCLCQAYQVTGDPAATDPTCGLSPHHERLTSLAATVGTAAAAPIPRRMG